MKLEDCLALALDPGRILLAQGIEPDEWQSDLLLSTSDRILLCCSRGAGKSRTCSAIALATALFEPGSLTLLVSRSLRQSMELLRYVREGFIALGSPLPTKKWTEDQIELANGSRIVSLPCNEETIRSFQGVTLLLIDEAARVPDEVYYSVRPMLNVSQGRLICLSTPFGARGFFWKEWHQKDVPWHRIRITWHDCPRISDEAIDEERLVMGDQWVAQEYECSFVTMQGLVYPDFENVIVDQDQMPEGKPVGGIDFGWRNPFAAIWGVLDDNDVLWICGERYGSEIPLHQHVAALKEHREVMWYADPAGRTEIEEMLTAGLKVRRGDNSIRNGIAAVNARIHTDRLRVLRSRCPRLIQEAGLYRYPSEQEESSVSEVPLDAHNHALGALRYLISKIDARFMGKLRQRQHA